MSSNPKSSPCSETMNLPSPLNGVAGSLMRIGNKEKQAKGEEKKTASRLLRRDPLDKRQKEAVAKRHNQSRCPICSTVIGMTAAGGRRKDSCSSCGATLNKELI